MSGFAEFLEPSGAWRREYENLEEEEVLAAIAESPLGVLKLVWNEESSRVLQQKLGIQPRSWHEAARRSVRTLSDALVREGLMEPHQAAVMCLAMESLLRNPRKPLPVPGGPDGSVMRSWIRGLDSRLVPESGETPLRLHSVSAASACRLAVEPSWLQERDQFVRAAVVRVVLTGWKTLSGQPRLPGLVQVRLAALRVWVIAREGGGGDSFGETQVIRQAGLDPAVIESIIDDLRSDRGHDRLMSGGGSADVASLISHSAFSESSEFYGFVLDPEAWRLSEELDAQRRTTSDPWVAGLLDLAASDGPVAAAALAECRRLGADRAKRARVIDTFLEQRLLDSGEFDRIADAELGDRAALYCCLFRELLRIRMVDGADHWRSTEQLLSIAGLRDWFRDALRDYRVRPQGGREAIPDEDVRARMVEVGSDVWSVQPFVHFHDWLREDSAQLLSRRDRLNARDDGREWLFRLVEWCEHRDPAQWDEGWGILTGEDRSLLRRLIGDKLNRQPRWWNLRLDDYSEMRLRERMILLTGEDDDSLRRLVEKTASELRVACLPRGGRSDADHERRLSLVLDEISRYILTHTGSPDQRLLALFREGNVVDFRLELEPPMIDLPPRRRRSSRVGGGALVLLGLLLAIPLLMLSRIAWLERRTDVAERAESLSMERVAPFAATIPAELSWTPLEGGRSWAFFATSDDLRGVMAPGMTFSPLASARAEVEFEVAEEFLRRHRLELLARFPAGVEVGGRLLPWSSLELRMPSASDPLASFRGLDPDERVWLADGSLRASEAERIESDDQQGLIYVLVNFR